MKLNVLAETAKFIETLAKIGIVVAIIVIIATGLMFTSFLFWNGFFYPYVKKIRVDDAVKKQKTELEKIYVQKQVETEKINEILIQKQEILQENNYLLIENEKLRDRIEKLNQELDLAEKNMKKNKKKEEED